MLGNEPFNRLRDRDDEYTYEAFTELKSFIVCTAQLTLRSQSSTDIQRIIQLINLPQVYSHVLSRYTHKGCASFFVPKIPITRSCPSMKVAIYMLL